MEFDPSKLTDGFLFIWNVENVYACDDLINSPTFIAPNLEKTEWSMSISRESSFVHLKRIDNNSVAEAIEFDVIVSVVLSDESKNLLEKENKLKFRKDVSKFFVFFLNQLIFEEDNLKIYCYLRKSEELNESLIRCSALTHLQSERRNDVWKVQNFRHLMTNDPKTFILESTGKESPQTVLTGRLSKRSKLFHVEVSVPDFLCYKKIFIIGKISVLAADGSLKYSIKGSFIFNNNTSLNTVSKFPTGICQASVLQLSDEYLTHGDLLLMCDFFISNGEIYHEVRESCYLRNKHKFIAESHILAHSMIEENIPRVPEEDTGESTQDLKSSHEFEQPTETLEDDVNYEYLDKKYCDVILTTGNNTFPVHKCILCLKSPVFKKMFDTDMKETSNKNVDIDDLDSNTLRRFLLFLYTENLENLQWEIATKLFYAAVKYHVTSLKVKCSCFLESHLSMSNVC
ncbi:hypothetical protein AVEN_233247-1, partial [Araneus ventricosus]